MTIKVLTHKDFGKLEEKIKSKNTILLIHATWCMHCKIFKPKWNEFGKKITSDKDIKKSDIQVFEIESENLNKLAKSHPSVFNYIAKTAKSPDVYFPKVIVFKKTASGVSKKEYRQDEGDLFDYVKTKVIGVKKTTVPMIVPPVQKLSSSKKQSLPVLINMMLNKYMKL